MKITNSLLAVLVAASIGALAAFIVQARTSEESSYAEWTNAINTIKLDSKTAERAILATRINYSKTYDEITQLVQSLYTQTRELERLSQLKDAALKPRAMPEIGTLISHLDEFRNMVFDFESESSTLTSSKTVFYNTVDELSKLAASADEPVFALTLLDLEAVVLADITSSVEEKRISAVEHIKELESVHPEFIAKHPLLWLSVTEDVHMILDYSDYLNELLIEKEVLHASLEQELSNVSSSLQDARLKARLPELVATGLLIAELIFLVMFFLFRSSRLGKELKHHADELENIVALRTQALEMAMDNLEKSTAEKEKIAEELRLAHRLEAIGQLAAGIAHEINTPSQFVNDNLQFILEAHSDLAKVRHSYAESMKQLASASGNKNLLEEMQDLEDEVDLEFLEEEVPSALKNSLEGMERISKIVKSMKDFSHPGSDGRALADINEAIETTLSVARNEWKYTASINKSFAEDLPHAPVFVSELNQVMLNIIVNAAHAIEQKNANTGSDEMGIITLKTEYDEHYVDLRIRDSGCGIPQENIDRVFDPFFTTKEVGKGTGQGLSIARKIVVDTHGGILNVSSELGEFTEFHIRLPRTVEQSGAENQKNNEGTETATS